LCQLAQQCRSHNSDDECPRFLNFDAFAVNDLWLIYERVETFENKFNLNTPVLILMHELVRCNEIRAGIEAENEKVVNSEDNSSSYKNILDRLFEIIDSDDNSSSDNTNRLLKTVVKEILKNGIWLFFPAEKLRKDYFLSMVAADHEQFSLKRESTKILFEAFCALFTVKKHLIVQSFVKPGIGLFENETSQLSDLVKFIDTLIELQHSLLCIPGNEDIVRALCDLLNSIQSYLFYSVKEHLVNHPAAGIHQHHLDGLDNVKLAVEAEMANRNLNQFLISYMNLMVNKSEFLVCFVRFFDNTCDKNRLVLTRVDMFFKNFVYHFVLWLSEILKDLDVTVATEIATTLVSFHKLLSELDKYCLVEEVVCYI
jgi:hypothetical protein